MQHTAAEIAYRASRWATPCATFAAAAIPAKAQPLLLFYFAVSLWESGSQQEAAAVMRRCDGKLRPTPFVQAYRDKHPGRLRRLVGPSPRGACRATRCAGAVNCYTRSSEESLMRSAVRAGSFAVAFSLSLGAGASAQVPRVLIGDLACIPRDGHAVAQAVAGPLAPSEEVRVYFRRQGYGDFYWVPARPSSDGRFWGVCRSPSPTTSRPRSTPPWSAANGVPRAQSRVISVPVEPNCRVQLGNAQQADSQHLVVGETSLGQKFRKVAWWRCDGIRERVDVRGERRDDESCLPLAWWDASRDAGAAGADHRRRHHRRHRRRRRRWGPRRSGFPPPTPEAASAAGQLPVTNRHSCG